MTMVPQRISVNHCSAFQSIRVRGSGLTFELTLISLEFENNRGLAANDLQAVISNGFPAITLTVF